MNTHAPIRGFDFHCHVDLFQDPAAMIASCERERIVTLAVTTTPKAWTQNRRWTAESRYVYTAAGLHPELAGERYAEIDLLERLIAETPFVGEVGLDGSTQHRQTRHIQKSVFVRVLAKAESVGGRVVSIHSRRAAKDVLECLSEHTTPSRVLPILHWFSDSASLASRAAEQGCYFSVNHKMLATNAGKTIVCGLPAARLLTETDAPFTESDGRKSEPRDVVQTAEALAVVRGVSAARMLQTLRENAARVFAFAGCEGSLPA